MSQYFNGVIPDFPVVWTLIFMIGMVLLISYFPMILRHEAEDCFSLRSQRRGIYPASVQGTKQSFFLPLHIVINREKDGNSSIGLGRSRQFSSRSSAERTGFCRCAKMPWNCEKTIIFTTVFPQFQSVMERRRLSLFFQIFQIFFHQGIDISIIPAVCRGIHQKGAVVIRLVVD